MFRSSQAKYIFVSSIDFPFLSLSYFQQWVLLTLYFSYKYKNERGTQTENEEYLQMNACMSAMVPGFDEDKANSELSDLVEHGLINLEDADTKEYKIKLNGSVFVKQSTTKIHDLLENPDFDTLIENIKSKGIVDNLKLIRNSDDYTDTDSTMKKILRLGIANVSGFSTLVLNLIKGLQTVI